jgi:hypothetical protein
MTPKERELVRILCGHILHENNGPQWDFYLAVLSELLRDVHNSQPEPPVFAISPKPVPYGARRAPR